MLPKTPPVSVRCGAAEPVPQRMRMFLNGSADA